MPKNDRWIPTDTEKAKAVIAEIDSIMGFGPGKPTVTYDEPQEHPTDSTKCLICVEERIRSNPRTRQVLFNAGLYDDLKDERPTVFEDARKAKDVLALSEIDPPEEEEAKEIV